MLKRISISTVLILVLCTNALLAQDEVTIPVGDSTIVFSPLKFLNAYAEAAGVDVLSEAENSNIVRLRLWGTLSHSFAARFLDISIDSDQIAGKWYASWANDSRHNNANESYEKWNCISDIQTVSTDFGSRSGCLIAEAETEELRLIRELVFESDFIELLRQPLERRVQLDGRSLLVEMLDQEGHEFISFMSYHINNHPQKELIEKARTVLNLWQNFSPQ
jgi:hypothetical protein